MPIFQTIKVLYTLISFQIDLIQKEGMFSVNIILFNDFRLEIDISYGIVVNNENVSFYIKNYHVIDIL